MFRPLKPAAILLLPIVLTTTTRANEPGSASASSISIHRSSKATSEQLGKLRFSLSGRWARRAQLQRLADEARQTQAELGALQRVDTRLQPFQRVKYSSPFINDRELTRLMMLELQQRLRRLQQAYGQAQQFRFSGR